MTDVILNQLTPDAVRAVLNGNALAIHVPGYLAAREAATIEEAIHHSPAFNLKGGFFTGLGPSGLDLPRQMIEYKASQQAAELALEPVLTHLKASLGLITVPSFDGAPMRALTARQYDTFHVLPHIDWDNEQFPWSAPGQLGLSITISAPETSSGIRLWDLDMDRHHYDKVRIPGQLEVPEGTIRQHHAVLFPKIGDLIYLNTHKFHAIGPATNWLTVSGFLGFNARGWLAYS